MKVKFKKFGDEEIEFEQALINVLSSIDDKLSSISNEIYGARIGGKNL